MPSVVQQPLLRSGGQHAEAGGRMKMAIGDDDGQLAFLRHRPGGGRLPALRATSASARFDVHEE